MDNESAIPLLIEKLSQDKTFIENDIERAKFIESFKMMLIEV